jgi:hypothetical protein
MATQTSVVTPERFATGFASFGEWQQKIENRQEEFQKHYDEYQPNADDVAALKKAVEARGVKALLIGENWCPDVWRGLPVVAKMQEATGMQVRYFFRDENKDIMAEFLNKGEFESIPTVVFYDGQHNYLGHWIERPQLALDDMARLRKEILEPAPREDGPERQAAQAKYREATAARAADWRHASLKEMRELVETAPKRGVPA